MRPDSRIISLITYSPFGNENYVLSEPLDGYFAKNDTDYQNLDMCPYGTLVHIETDANHPEPYVDSNGKHWPYFLDSNFVINSANGLDG